ncbi:MAG: dihydroneopterin aldolase [Candidatus Contendobacter odensis]|uniref:7,8-dihydroneopterin aldolase n=1 Tax=Candidatus Contendibacter odensensis TaxID=1400860 RepID=A0A2G6PGQ0_9GAMM|nr:MAG: dihydroneopterin aldolase [Candidatus Contendobacter odensis]
MDIIFIRELRVETIIGVHCWERQIRQPLLLDLEMGTSILPAATSDKLDDTLDYQAVVQQVNEFAEKKRFQLIETFAEQLARLLLQEFALPWLRLTLSKPGAIRDARTVGIIIERKSCEACD